MPRLLDCLGVVSAFDILGDAIDMAALADIRERLPALRHRRTDAYGLEEEHLADDRLEAGS